MPDKPEQLAFDLRADARPGAGLPGEGGAAARPSQLALDLPPLTRFAAEDFLVGDANRQAYAVIEAWPQWPAPVMRLAGPPGSGKSHLAAIWAERSGARALPAAQVSLEMVPELAESPLVLEDIDRGRREEAALFHLVNLARERQSWLLLTAAAPIDGCGFRTPDLLSRLRLAPVAGIAAPDDALLRAVLVKLFLDRQLMVDASVVAYIASRAERSLAFARRVVCELDQEALSRRGRVTRAMAGEVLARLSVPD